MEYIDQLYDYRWIQKRNIILKRDGFLCRHPRCNYFGKNLEVHHKDYIPGQMAWEYPDDMLITLCKFHHSKEIERDKTHQYLIGTLKMKGFFLSDLLALACKIDTDYEFTETLLKTLRES